MNRTLAAAALAWLVASSSALAADGIETRPVHFAKGTSTAQIKSELRGYQTIDYKFSARAGQTLRVRLHSSHLANYFNLMAPGAQGEAFFIGSTEGDTWAGILPADGEYTVRVYLMRSAARRNETARFTLDLAIDALPVSGPLGRAPASDAKIPGTPFHASGTVACSSGSEGALRTQCSFNVIRGSAGQAEVHLKSASGSSQILRFDDGRVRAVNAPAASLKSSREGDDWQIEFNGERYRIPEAVISGG